MGEHDMLGQTAGAYLRKSRMEEGMDTEEILRRHRAGLLECAQRHGLLVEDWYPEVVSGESLYARPQMLRLLEDVEAGRYDAVLCMDLDRLSRGRMKDQGIILDAFRDSGTRIVTPEKVYDLSDEIDDELAEFKTFMSRREYKIINKRLRRGLHRSIQDGCYVANAPYGYRKVTIDRRPTLEIYEPEAKFVRLMYQLYASGCGCVSVANPWGHAHTGPAPSPETAWRPSSATPPISGRSSGTRGHISGKAARAARSTSQSAIPGKNGPSPTDSIRLLWSRRCTTRYRISWPADTALPTRTVPQRARWPVWSSAPTAAATCSA